MLYFFISKNVEVPEIQIEYVLPDEPIRVDPKRRYRYYSTPVRTTEKDEQHDPPNERQRTKQNLNTSVAEAESYSLNDEVLDESVQEVLLLEERIAKLSQDRKSGLATYENAVDAIIEYSTRQNELHGQNTYLKISGFEENSPSRAAVLRELSDISRKFEQLDRQKEEVRQAIEVIDQELPMLHNQLKAMQAAHWDVDNTRF